MSDLNNTELYTKLFASRNEGNYLLSPLPYESIHPGSVGYFNPKSGRWTSIADLTDPEKTLQDGYTMPHPRSLRKLIKDTLEWNTRTSESESERSYRATVGASGAAGGVPVEGSVAFKYKSGSNGKAALVTKSLVKFEEYEGPFAVPIRDWIKENGEKIVNLYQEEIADVGLWAVQSVWVADECAVTISSGSSQDIDLGADVGATGFGKLGGGTALLDKLQSEGWTRYPSIPGSKGRVVSFSGVKYKPRNFSKLFRSSALKEVVESVSALLDQTAMQPMFDEAGDLKSFEEVRRVKKSSTGEYEIERVEKQESDENDFEEDELLEYEGMKEQDVQAERLYQEQQKQEHEQEMLKRWTEFVEQTEELNKKIRKEKAEGLNPANHQDVTPVATVTVLSRPQVGSNN